MSLNVFNKCLKFVKHPIFKPYDKYTILRLQGGIFMSFYIKLLTVSSCTESLNATKTLTCTFSSKTLVPLHLESNNALSIVTFFISLPLSTLTVESLWPFPSHQPKLSCERFFFFSLDHSVIHFSRDPSVLLMKTLWKFAQDLNYPNAGPYALY